VRNTNRAENINNQLKTLSITTTEGGLALRSYAPLRGEKLAEGDLVWYGISLVTIPDMTEMKVTISASESDYKRIDVNSKVNYTFSSMPGNKAFGKIIKKAPMGIPINHNSKVKRFEITASVDSFDVMPEPGLSAICLVTLKEIPDTIVVPQLAIFEEDSVKYVYIYQNRKFEKQEIILGQYSPKLAVIVAGLTGNEQVSFVKPPSSKISKTIALPDSIKKIYSSPNSGKAVENTLINLQKENTLIKTQRVKN
jgi:HlyD family secretion protein